MTKSMTRRLICLQDDTVSALDGLVEERNKSRSELIEMMVRQHSWMVRMGQRMQILPWADRATQGGKPKLKRKKKAVKETVVEDRE
jgi:metal-responsive CopG/Arc/MetJ family transcriptional regulator